ncbi:MAG: hypothetical protein EBZ46_05055 [Actinobacteria bacterium]|nr:hypothetical protein [Actinomycetota bacterium]
MVVATPRTASELCAYFATATPIDDRVLLAGNDDPHPGADESPLARWFSFADAYAIADAGLQGGLAIAERTYVRYRA